MEMASHAVFHELKISVSISEISIIKISAERSGNYFAARGAYAKFYSLKYVRRGSQLEGRARELTVERIPKARVPFAEQVQYSISSLFYAPSWDFLHAEA